MKRLLLIPLVLFLACEDNAKTIHGCFDSQACNYNPLANIDNNSCIYEFDCNGDCGGPALIDSCDVCDSDTTNDCALEVEYSSIQNGETLYGNGLIIKFSEPLALNQFDDLSDFLGNLSCHSSDSSIFNLGSSEYFNFNGNNLSLVIYDSSNYTCAFFEQTTLDFPDGTGWGLDLQEQNLILIKKNLKSVYNRILKTDFSLSFNISELYDINTVPNLTLINTETVESYFRFINLPETCNINIYSSESQFVTTLYHNNESDSNHFWDFRVENQYINPGIYRYSLDIDNTSYPMHGVFMVKFMSCNY